MESKGMQSMKVKLIGAAPILFDRFIDMSADQRPPEQKLYLNDKGVLTLPALNVISFFFGENPGGCAARFEKKARKDYQVMGMSHVVISPNDILFTRNGKPVVFTKFVDNYDKAAGIRVLYHKANVKKSGLIIPSPKVRPALELPWELEFEITLFENHLISIKKLQNWLLRGGMEIALGTYRPLFGRFMAEFA